LQDVDVQYCGLDGPSLSVPCLGSLLGTRTSRAYFQQLAALLRWIFEANSSEPARNSSKISDRHFEPPHIEEKRRLTAVTKSDSFRHVSPYIALSMLFAEPAAMALNSFQKRGGNKT
jgi:hypothetical protein